MFLYELKSNISNKCIRNNTALKDGVMNFKITVLLITCFAIFASICIKADSVSMEPPFKFHSYERGFFGILPTWRPHDIDGIERDGKLFNFSSRIDKSSLSFQGGQRCHISTPVGAKFYKTTGSGVRLYVAEDSEEYVSFTCR